MSPLSCLAMADMRKIDTSIQAQIGFWDMVEKNDVVKERCDDLEKYFEAPISINQNCTPNGLIISK